MNIAVEGCCHGELDKIYEKIKNYEYENNIKVDLLLCCGDFQAIRHEQDLNDLCCPLKYKAYRDFKDYYNCNKQAPILTIFVGGNHESPDLLRNLYYGGWVAPNIYYLGHSGVVNVEGIRIAGISGIYNTLNYTKGYFETYPYNEETKRSAYHVREFDIKKLSMIKTPIDIFLSHDWPAGIENYGNLEELIRIKPYFYEDIRNNTLGNPKTRELLNQHKPRFWFSGHMHVKYEAICKHDDGTSTYFLALDKVLPYREFLRVLQIFPRNFDQQNRNVTYKRNRQECETSDHINDQHGDNNFNNLSSTTIDNNDMNKNEENVDKNFGNNVEHTISSNSDTNNNNLLENKVNNNINNIKLCYDREWCSILVSNKDKIPLNSFPSVNPISLNEPTEKDYEFVDNSFKKSGYEKLYFNNQNYYIIPFYKDIHLDPNYQRQKFMEIFNLPDNSYFNPKLNEKFKVNFVE